MKRLYGSFAVKILAFLLMTAFIAAGTASVVGLIYMSETPDFSRCDSYFETVSCRDTLRNAAQQVYDSRMMYEEWEGLDVMEDEYPYIWEGYQNGWLGNVEFRIYSPSGELILESFNAFPESEAGHVHTLTADDCVIKTYVSRDLPIGTSGISLEKMIFDFSKEFGAAFMPTAAVSVIGALACFVFIVRAAGHRRDTDEIVLNAFDRIPLDLYLCADAVLITLVMSILIELSYGPNFGIIVMFAVMAVLAVYMLCYAAFITVVTRLKYGKFWRNTLIWRWGGALLRFCWRVLLKMKPYVVRAFGWLLRPLGSLWRWAKSAVLRVKGALREAPLFWKALVALAGLVLVELILVLMATASYSAAPFVLSIVLHMLLFAFCFKMLLDVSKLEEAARALADGEADHKVDTSHMLWSLRSHGEALNSIGDGIAVAVDKQIRSERLKAELITNVSHDIKTPLTSIVNYVDLLKKEELSGKAAEYVEVLDRQSARLKKLTADLVEASKASTGNIPVDMKPTDLCEVVRQAAGEYSERLQGAKLELVLTTPEPSPRIMADGRLLWRVIDNLLSNVCKYALGGTRVYLDVRRAGGGVTVSVKNISRDMLNIDPEELTERFVRGDRSRSTEGSGLGLNIARSLTELQQGEFGISVDGDLFKVELRFKEMAQ